MEIVSEIPNLRTAQEKHQERVKKNNYYKRRNDEDWQIINKRNEYYKFLLRCIQMYYVKISNCDSDINMNEINDIYDFEISNIEIVKEIKEFLQLNNIGKVTEENHIIDEHCEYSIINIKFSCSFDEFFNAFYNEIQYMEYYETNKEEAQKKYRKFLERDKQIYGKYIDYHSEKLDSVLPHANNYNIPANQIYRVITMLEDNDYEKYGTDKLKYIVADLYKLGFSTEKIMEFTELSEESVEKHKKLRR